MTDQILVEATANRRGKWDPNSPDITFREGNEYWVHEDCFDDDWMEPVEEAETKSEPDESDGSTGPDGADDDADMASDTESDGLEDLTRSELHELGKEHGGITSWRDPAHSSEEMIEILREEGVEIE